MLFLLFYKTDLLEQFSKCFIVLRKGPTLQPFLQKRMNITPYHCTSKCYFFLPRAIEKTIFSFCSKYLKLFYTANIICEPGPRHVLQLTSRVIDFPLTSGSLLNAAVGNVCLTLYRCTTHWQSIQRNDKTPQSCTNPLGPREQHKATP